MACGLLQQLSSVSLAAEMPVCAGEQCKCVLLLAVAILLLCCWFCGHLSSVLQWHTLTLCGQTSRYEANTAAASVAHAEAMEECRTRYICLQVCIACVV